MASHHHNKATGNHTNRKNNNKSMKSASNKDIKRQEEEFMDIGWEVAKMCIALMVLVIIVYLGFAKAFRLW
jgi:hypothetical protein